jgi:hypothetical protein
MATGKIKSVFPPGNQGNKPGAGQIIEDVTGAKFVFHTPDDLDPAAVPISGGTAINFDIGSGNSVSNVRLAAPALACTLNANPTSVKVGVQSTLSWTSSNANQLVIDNGVGDVTTLNPSSVPVAPRGTTTYTLTATNSASGQSVSASVTVQVG